MKNYILRYILILLSILLGVSNSYSQAIEKGTGMTYTKGVPTHIPRIKFDAEINMDINTGRLYQWSQPVNQWRLMARGVDVGNFNGAPTYVPGYGQSTFVINNQKQIYYYSGNVWSCLTCAVGAVGAYNGLSRFSDSIVLGGTLDRSTTIRGVSTFPLIFDSLSTFRVTTSATLGNSYNVISSIPFLDNGITLSAVNVLDPNISTSLNVRAQNESQLASRNDTNQAYFRLTPTSAYLGSGLIANPSSNKQFRIENDSFLFINMEYAPAESNDFLVITPDGVVFKDSTALSPTLVAGQGISISGDTIRNTGDLNAANEIQWIDSFYISNDTLFLSLSLDIDTTSWVILPSIAGGNGIYGGSGTVPGATVATIDSSLLFSSQESLNQFSVSMTNPLGTFGSSMISRADSLALRYFDVASDSRVTVNSNGVLLRTQTPDRVIIQGADARYQADYRSTYGDRSLIDKKFADDTYARNGMNIGTGSGVFAAKVDSILQFKSLFGSTGINISSDATTITFKADTTLLATVYDVSQVSGFANPMTTLGDVIYGAASGTPTRLAGNTTTTKQFLSQTGTGSASAAPSWSAVTKSDVGLSNVENTALSTWSGSSNITTLGTVTTGTWNASTIAVNKGGTGATSLTGVLVGNGTSAVTGVTGTANQIIKFDGSQWIASNQNTYQLINTAQTISDAVNQVYINTLSGNTIFTLPSCTSSTNGLKYEITKMGADNFSATIRPSATQQFFGSSPEKVLYHQGNGIICTCNGTGTWLYSTM